MRTYGKRVYKSKKRTATRYTKRNTRYNRKRRGIKTASPSIPASVSIRRVFPPKMYCKLSYADLLVMTVNTAALGPFSGAASQIWQSSLYDPDLSGTGHQPMYYDRLCGASAIYSYYRVFGIGYRFEVTNTNTNQDMPVCLLFTPAPTAVSVNSKADWLRLEEQSNSKSYSVGSQSSRTRVIKGYMSVAKTNGVKPLTVRTDDRYRSAYNFNPSEMAYLHFYITSGNTGTTNVAQVKFKMMYYVELSGLSIEILS